MAVNTLYGAWKQEISNLGSGPEAVAVFIDGPAVGEHAKTPGLVRVSPVSINPSLMERWAIQGWTVRLALVYNVIVQPYFASLGKLWAGLAIESQQTDQGGLLPGPGGLSALPGRAQFPPDLSTFDVIWTQDDDVAIVNWDQRGALPGSAIPSLVAKTFMLPSPVEVRPGSQMQMQLVLTPGIYGWFNTLACVDGSWSLLYDDGAKT
jgi:hypothetical protein